MKVIFPIDLVRFPLTGIGRYVWELAYALQASPELSHLLFLQGRRLLDTLPVLDATEHHTSAFKKMAQQSWMFSEIHRYLSPLIQGRALRSYQDHLFHGPNFYLPPFAGKRVATFHDLTPFKWTECITPQRARYIQQRCLYTIKHADGLLTDSVHVKNELAEYFSYPLDKIHVTPLAASPIFYPRNETETRSVLMKYGLSYQGYCLFVGTIEPRKNLHRLLEAYQGLPIAIRRTWPLVVSGYAGWKSEAIHAHMSQAQSEGWLKYIGYTPAQELPCLFAGAGLFVFPSVYEGFGLPPLEAMASGVPVISSDQGALPEVLGDAALLFNPYDVDELRARLEQALNDDEWRRLAINQGRQQAEKFTWSACARDTLTAYRAVLATS